MRDVQARENVLTERKFQPIQKGVFISDEIGIEALKPHFPL